MNPYPLYYCPPGIARPTHIPWQAGMRMQADASPDGSEGILYAPSADIPPGLAWQKTDAGWYLLMGTHRPQDLVRLNPSPRIVAWHALAGAEPGHVWRVPVLLTPADPAASDTDKTYVSGLDRIWRGGTWGSPPELLDAQRQLLAVMHGVALADDLEARNRAFLDLAITILSQAHHVSPAEFIHGGWMSEGLPAKVLLLAANRPDLLTESAA